LYLLFRSRFVESTEEFVRRYADGQSLDPAQPALRVDLVNGGFDSEQPAQRSPEMLQVHMSVERD
jgi:hypothetical protein